MNDKSYKNWASMSDQALSKMIGSFIRQQRLDQNKTQKEIARDAGISRSTLSLLERGETVTLSTLIQILRVLDLLHILEIFEVRQQISPVEYARLQQKKRKRARSIGLESNSVNEDEPEW